MKGKAFGDLGLRKTHGVRGQIEIDVGNRFNRGYIHGGGQRKGNDDERGKGLATGRTADTDGRDEIRGCRGLIAGFGSEKKEKSRKGRRYTGTEGRAIWK